MHAAEELRYPTDELTRRAQARVGQLVRERWHLDALLGVGGMAAVYAATHRNGKRVALKMLHPELSTNSEIKQRFVDEGYAANHVEHPGVVSVIDDDMSEDGAVFLVMELLDGETVEQRIAQRKKIPPAEVLEVADGLLDVLAAAHDNGIVHRDIKPDNIFITRDGAIRLLDFGIARVIGSRRPRTTQSGTALGTPAFMPPEQARGRSEQLDGRTDLWALGATMYLQLTGRYVHEAETLNEELLLAMTTPANSLADIAPELPKPLVELVDRALAFDPADRWADAREMQAAVRKVAALLPFDAPGASPADRAGTNFTCAPTLVTPSLRPNVYSTPDAALARPGARWRKPILVAAAAAMTGFVSIRVPFERQHPISAAAPPPISVAAAEPVRAAEIRKSGSEEPTTLAPDHAAHAPDVAPSSETAPFKTPAPSRWRAPLEKVRTSRTAPHTTDDAKTAAASNRRTATSTPAPRAPALSPHGATPASEPPPPPAAAIDPLERRK